MGLSWTRTPELAASVVRRRRHEVRHPEAPARQATSWIRSHEGVGRADARLLLAVAGYHLSNLAVARGRGAPRCARPAAPPPPAALLAATHRSKPHSPQTLLTSFLL